MGTYFVTNMRVGGMGSNENYSFTHRFTSFKTCHYVVYTQIYLFSQTCHYVVYTQIHQFWFQICLFSHYSRDISAGPTMLKSSQTELFVELDVKTKTITLTIGLI